MNFTWMDLVGRVYFPIGNLIPCSGLWYPTDLRGIRHVRSEHRTWADLVPPVDIQRQRQRKLLLRHQPRIRHGADILAHRPPIRLH